MKFSGVGHTINRNQREIIVYIEREEEERGAEITEMEAVVTGSSDHFKTCIQIEKNGKAGENERGWNVIFVHTSVFPTVSFNCPFIFFLCYNAFS